MIIIHIFPKRTQALFKILAFCVKEAIEWDETLKNNAATKIASAYRGYSQRKSMKSLREERKDESECIVQLALVDRLHDFTSTKRFFFFLLALYY